MKFYYETDGITNERNSSEIEILKDTKMYLYFKVINGCNSKYRMVKSTGNIQVAPYWNNTKCVLQ